MKWVEKLSPTTPPAAATARNWSSVRLRPCPQTARESEWVAINGRLARFCTSQKPLSLRWETSTTIPASSSSGSASRPRGVSPSSQAMPLPSSFLPFQVRVRTRTPHSRSRAIRPRSPASAEPPSTVSSAAHLPPEMISRMSAAVNACAARSAFSASCPVKNR